MDRDGVVDFIIENLEKKSLTVSPSTVVFLHSTGYINEDLIAKTDQRTIQKNLRELIAEIINTYERRTEEAKRPTKVRDKDVRKAVKIKYCSLPPFCKST